MIGKLTVLGLLCVRLKILDLLCICEYFNINVSLQFDDDVLQIKITYKKDTNWASNKMWSEKELWTNKKTVQKYKVILFIYLFQVYLQRCC